MAEELSRELDWDEGIELTQGGFEVLPEGEYEFTVVKFERQRHAGSDKLPSCPKAVLTLDMKNAEGRGQVTHNLFLHTKTQGLLSAFFVSIGQGNVGDKIKLDWGKVPGATGRAKVTIRKFTKKDGSEGESNDVTFLPPLRNWTAGGF
jgi:hypothetical protein